jgi:hypothetical protein
MGQRRNFSNVFDLQKPLPDQSLQAEVHPAQADPERRGDLSLRGMRIFLEQPEHPKSGVFTDCVSSVHGRFDSFVLLSTRYRRGFRAVKLEFLGKFAPSIRGGSNRLRELTPYLRGGDIQPGEEYIA